MLEDSYSEYSVTRKRANWVIPAWVGFALAVLAVIYFVLCMNWLLVLLALAIAAALLIILLRYSSVIYEYIYVLDELTVDKIYRKSFRKAAEQIALQDVEAICPTEDSDAERMKASPNVVYQDYTSHEKDRPSYTVKYVRGGKTYFMFFEPNEVMLRQLKHDHSGRVKLRK